MVINNILNDKEVENAILNYCLTSNDSTWAYLPNFLNYQILYSNSKVINCSFLVKEKDRIVGVFPLFIEESSVKTFSIAGGYLRGPLIDNLLDAKAKKNVLKLMFSELNRISYEYNVEKALIMLDPLSTDYNFNYLVEYDFYDSSINTNIINLSKDLRVLWQNLRKSYQSIINKGKRTYTIKVLDFQTPDFSKHEQYRILHHKCAGRITRSLETFELQYRMLKDDNAILIYLESGGKFLASSYFFHHNGTAYYASSSDDPDHIFPVPFEHIIIWSAIEYYKNRNYKKLELGWQFFSSSIFDIVTNKELNIAFFKRGFGGNNRTLYRGIKYFNKHLMIKELSSSFQKFISNLNLSPVE